MRLLKKKEKRKNGKYLRMRMINDVKKRKQREQEQQRKLRRRQTALQQRRD